MLAAAWELAVSGSAREERMGKPSQQTRGLGLAQGTVHAGARRAWVHGFTGLRPGTEAASHAQRRTSHSHVSAAGQREARHVRQDGGWGAGS